MNTDIDKDMTLHMYIVTQLYTEQYTLYIKLTS